MIVSKRAQIEAFRAMEVMKEAGHRAAAGESILSLSVGQPSTGAPRPVIEAAQAALRNGRLGYTEATGIAPLRAAIAGHYRDFYGVTVAADRIVVTTGSSTGFILAFLALFDAGDCVGMVQPGYPGYRNILRALDVTPVSLPVGAQQGFRPTPALFERAGRLDGLLLASPGNPTGTMLDAAGIQALIAFADGRGIPLVMDEIYHGITYGGKPPTALAFSDRVVVVNSFSKYFCMTGWRLGWLVVPEDLVAPLERLAQHMLISPPTLSQLAAVRAFEAYDELDRNVARYARNRALLLNEMPAAGFDRLAPADGAFYLYADVSRWSNDSVMFCHRMLDEIGVAATPGLDFDPDDGQHFVRFAFAGDEAVIAEAVKRLNQWRK